MDDRFAELEAHLRAWERRNRRRTLLLVLVPLLAAAALAYVGHARVERVETGLAASLSGVSEDVAGAPLDRRLERVRALAEEVRGLRPLPGQLADERDARTRAESELARVGGRVATLTGERDALAAALGTAKAELSRAEAERTEQAQRLADLERVSGEREAAVSGLERELRAEREARQAAGSEAETRAVADAETARVAAAEASGRAGRAEQRAADLERAVAARSTEVNELSRRVEGEQAGRARPSGHWRRNARRSRLRPRSATGSRPNSPPPTRPWRGPAKRPRRRARDSRARWPGSERRSTRRLGAKPTCPGISRRPGPPRRAWSSA
jgi:hypothetical protein